MTPADGEMVSEGIACAQKRGRGESRQKDLISASPSIILTDA
jgi:hypothetical protein